MYFSSIILGILCILTILMVVEVYKLQEIKNIKEGSIEIDPLEDWKKGKLKWKNLLSMKV